MSDIDVVAVINDLQVGGTTALMPPKVELYDGLIVKPSKLQRSMLKFWNSGWEEIYEAAEGYRLITVLNGEPCDGDHHDTWQLWSRRMTDQVDAAVELLTPIATKSDVFYVTRGTPAHSGKNFDADTEVAKEIGAYRRTVFPKLRLTIQGKTFLFTHHGPGPGRRDWTWGDTIRREIKDQNYRSLRRGSKLPDYYVWAHYHQKAHEPVKVERKGEEKIVNGYIVPGWQASTAYIAALNKGEEIVQIGMLYFIIEDGNVKHKWIVDTRDITESIRL
jgi:hypothetical protein